MKQHDSDHCQDMDNLLHKVADGTAGPLAKCFVWMHTLHCRPCNRFLRSLTSLLHQLHQLKRGAPDAEVVERLEHGEWQEAGRKTE